MAASVNHYFLNNKLQTDPLPEFKNLEIAVYEVIKIIGGIPLFYEDHIERLNNSMKMAHIEHFIFSKTEFLNQIKTLCTANNVFFGNVELRVSKLHNNNIIPFLSFIPHKYPEPISYIEGVFTSLLKAERESPNVKVKNTETRLKADNRLNNANIYEVLLVNNSGFITEGSRSNVFFIKNNSVYSAPVEFILPGITRRYALKVLENLNVTVVNSLYDSRDLGKVDAAFLCGTSPGILPIKQVDNFTFDVQNKILRNCMLGFNTLVNEYLSKTI